MSADPRLVPPTLDDVRRAAANIAPHLSLPTPLVRSPGLSELLEAEISLKLETATPISAFKVRGGVHYFLELSEAQRRRGFVTASSGNHAQSIAFGARLAGAEVEVFMPAQANPDKVAAVQRLGARVILEGRHYDDCRAACEEYAAEHGRQLIDAINEPALVAGVATAALEVLETQQPDTDLVIVPLGGGSGTCGWITVRDGLGRSTQIWATQSAQAPAVHDSWKRAERVERPNRTLAEGLATGATFELPFQILQAGLDDFVLVDDAQITSAVGTLFDRAHVLAEPAGACATAAAIDQAERLRGRKVVLVVSGANLTRDQLKAWI